MSARRLIPGAGAALAAAWLALAGAARAAGETGAAFLKVAAGAKPAALGEAVVGVVDDVNAVAWNPAGLAKVTTPQFTAVQSQWLQAYDHTFVAAAYPFSWGTLGVGLTSLSVDGIERRTTDVDLPEGTFGADDAAYNLSWGRGLGESWALGAGATFIRQTLDGRAGSGVAGNLGVQWRSASGSLSLGASVRHLGSEIKFDAEGDPLPAVAALGAGYRLFEGKLRLSSDVRFPQGDDASFGVGAELAKPLSQSMSAALRAGYNSAAADAGAGLTAGLGLTWNNWGFDLAWAPYGDLGQTFRYALLVKF